jgi:hypothetical protein
MMVAPIRVGHTSGKRAIRYWEPADPGRHDGRVQALLTELGIGVDLRQPRPTVGYGHAAGHKQAGKRLPVPTPRLTNSRPDRLAGSAGSDG